MFTPPLEGWLPVVIVNGPYREQPTSPNAQFSTKKGSQLRMLFTRAGYVLT